MPSKTYAATELAKLAWDETKTPRERLAAAEALQRQVGKLVKSLQQK